MTSVIEANLYHTAYKQKSKKPEIKKLEIRKPQVTDAAVTISQLRATIKDLNQDDQPSYDTSIEDTNIDGLISARLKKLKLLINDMKNESIITDDVSFS